MKVLEFAFIAYAVTDLARARRFYEDVLDFTPATTWGNETEGWVEYEVGPHTLAITNTGGENWRPSKDGAGVALEVEDFEGAINELKAHLVEFDMEPTSSPVCQMALILDPDGNRICIHKRHPAGADHA